MTTAWPHGRLIAVFVVVACAVPACGAPGRQAQTARVSDEWSRTYQLAQGAELQIANLTGNIDVETTDGPVVEVKAERVARSTTEQGARDLLTHVDIHETVEPGRVVVETTPIEGVMIGASYEVNYHVKVPPHTAVRARSANGSVRATGLGGKATLSARSGELIGRALSGSVEARTTNGHLDVEIVKGTAEFIDLRAINGNVDVALPKTMNANLSATATNGRVQVSDLEFESFGEPGQDRRRVRGRINAGGAPIEVSATNGSIRVRGHE